MSSNVKTGILVAALAAVAIVAALAKRSDVYLLTLCSVYLMATFGLNLTVGYAGRSFPLVLGRDKRSWHTG